MKRFQARRGNGRFQRNTLENCFGLRSAPCDCGAINPYGKVADHSGPFVSMRWDVPTHCARCGKPLPVPAAPAEEESP